jgi:hypothetical protein
MSSSLQITVQLASDNTWEILAVVVPGGSLPVDIFVYENTGNTTLGDYQGVCTLSDYQRMQTFTGSSITKFGNKFVKYGQAKIKIDFDSNPDDVSAAIIQSVKALSLAFQNAPSTTTLISIP